MREHPDVACYMAFSLGWLHAAQQSCSCTEKFRYGHRITWAPFCPDKALPNSTGQSSKWSVEAISMNVYAETSEQFSWNVWIHQRILQSSRLSYSVFMKNHKCKLRGLSILIPVTKFLMSPLEVSNFFLQVLCRSFWLHKNLHVFAPWRAEGWIMPS